MPDSIPSSLFCCCAPKQNHAACILVFAYVHTFFASRPIDLQIPRAYPNLLPCPNCRRFSHFVEHDSFLSAGADYIREIKHAVCVDNEIVLQFQPGAYALPYMRYLDAHYDLVIDSLDYGDDFIIIHYHSLSFPANTGTYKFNLDDEFSVGQGLAAAQAALDTVDATLIPWPSASNPPIDGLWPPAGNRLFYRVRVICDGNGGFMSFVDTQWSQGIEYPSFTDSHDCSYVADPSLKKGFPCAGPSAGFNPVAGADFGGFAARDIVSGGKMLVRAYAPNWASPGPLNVWLFDYDYTLDPSLPGSCSVDVNSGCVATRPFCGFASASLKNYPPPPDGSPNIISFTRPGPGVYRLLDPPGVC